MTAAPRAYEINGVDADARRFVELACDPARSVVVEACAGSGKTWLLVARMLRLLLAGAAPSELLAITFTRKAAQEMRERLLQLLRELALLPEADARALLRERGVAESDLARCMPQARSLYERVLASGQSLSIDTFHSWFARLIQIAPLASGVPHGYTLTERSGDLMTQAYSRLMQGLNQNAPIKQALLRLYDMQGDWNTKKMLDAFVAKRAEWWAATQNGDPLVWLQELCGDDGECDARLTLWDDDRLQARIQNIAWLLGQGTPINQKRATAIETALTADATIENFASLCHQFFDRDGDPRKNQKTNALKQALENNFGSDGMVTFDREFNLVGQALQHIQRRSVEPIVLALNESLFAVGAAYLEHYQTIKAEQRLFDFADLEWHAYRLLTHEAHAAYLQSRLDARYKHILLDEFQDTNPLQWNIVRAWLDAYGADSAQPSLFIVGDPKQSIYRFRRAEPRVFEAARTLLQQQGAVVLRTNQTRRNAGPIVDLLNASLGENPIFSAQTTLAGNHGAVWRLPLIRSDKTEEIEAQPFTLRDPLTHPRAEEEDARRLEEGRAVAMAILQAKRERTAQWSDVMLLVKKRANLRAYEMALREFGIPFVSDKRGGLLESLEVYDLIALLTFLVTPGDNLALAHVLKCPILGVDDDDLMTLALRTESTWWLRIQAALHEGVSVALRRAASLLEKWLHAASRLPVHDLLDLIMHESQLVACYARTAPPESRSQVLGNIDAFTELALSLDAGRYPSLPKFIDALRTLQNGSNNEAPDEANIDASTDAVRILTIHSAKGLEAPIVVLLDANHSEPVRDDIGILCDWPQDAKAPTHFSAFGRKAERGSARDVLFENEEKFKAQEDWNLLYVAATRAKELLIISGVAGTTKAGPDGVVEASWYGRLRSAQERPSLTPEETLRSARETSFTLPIFDPPPLAISPSLKTTDCVAGDAIEEGIALHALLERVTQAHAWPVELPEIALMTRWLDCSCNLAATVRAQAEAILSQAVLERFYNPQKYHAAYNEIEIMTCSGLIRLDRLVFFEQEVWILDYKRQILDRERVAYQQQIMGYAAAVAAVFHGKRIKAAFITGDGRLIEVSDLDESIDGRSPTTL